MKEIRVNPTYDSAMLWMAPSSFHQCWGLHLQRDRRRGSSGRCQDWKLPVMSSVFKLIPLSHWSPLKHFINTRSWPRGSYAKALWKLGNIPSQGATTLSAIRKINIPNTLWRINNFIIGTGMAVISSDFLLPPWFSLVIFFMLVVSCCYRWCLSHVGFYLVWYRVTWTCIFLSAASFLMPLAAASSCLDCLVCRDVDN